MVAALVQPENAEIIRAELRLLDGKYEETEECVVPCPFLAFLLGTSINVDFSMSWSSYLSSPSFEASLLPACAGRKTHATVIDVTDPMNPKCIIGGTSAEKYLRMEFKVPTKEEIAQNPSLEEWEDRIVDLIETMKDYPMIEEWALQEARGQKPDHVLSTPEYDSSIHDLHSTPSLLDASLTSTITTSIESRDVSSLERIDLVPRKADTVISHLRTYRPFPDIALGLLAKALSTKDPVHSDLVDVALAPMQVSRLAALLNPSKLEYINLSFNDQLNLNTLRSILPSMPNLKRLNVMGCASLSDSDIVSLLQDYKTLLPNIMYIAHPYFFSLNRELPFPCPFMFIEIGQWLNMGVLPFLNPTVIVRCLTDYFNAVLGHEETELGGLLMTSTMGYSLAEALFSSYHEADELWSERKLICKSSGRSEDFVEGRAWALLVDCSFGPSFHSDRYFAFVRILNPGSTLSRHSAKGEEQQSGALSIQVLGLIDFLAEITSGQTRPAPQEDVNALLDILAQLEVKIGMVAADEAKIRAIMDGTAESNFLRALGISYSFQDMYGFRE